MVKKFLIITLLAASVAACTPKQSKQDNTLKLTGSPTSLNNNIQAPSTPIPQPELVAQPNINLTKQEIASMSAKIVLKTTKGDITLKLYPDVAPQTVKNFLTKAKSDYYKGLTFHRVEDWVLQGGDPAGNGTGGGKMPTELSDTPFKEGSLGVARGGDIRISNDSQFFICTKDCAWLTGQYTVFGEVTEGMDIAKNMEIGDKILGLE